MSPLVLLARIQLATRASARMGTLEPGETISVLTVEVHRDIAALLPPDSRTRAELDAIPPEK